MKKHAILFWVAAAALAAALAYPHRPAEPPRQKTEEPPASRPAEPAEKTAQDICAATPPPPPPKPVVQKPRPPRVTPAVAPQQEKDTPPPRTMTDQQRAALDAINQNALVGIGARIQTDGTGWPKIMDTTVLSALASTGMARPGDYISGMVNSDGSVVDFKDRPIREVVQMLRGEPGTEVRLRMERSSGDGQTTPYSFDVPVLRSMVIVQPPF